MEKVQDRLLTLLLTILVWTAGIISAAITVGLFQLVFKG